MSLLQANTRYFFCAAGDSVFDTLSHSSRRPMLNHFASCRITYIVYVLRWDVSISVTFCTAAFVETRLYRQKLKFPVKLFIRNGIIHVSSRRRALRPAVILRRNSQKLYCVMNIKAISIINIVISYQYRSDLNNDDKWEPNRLTREILVKLPR